MEFILYIAQLHLEIYTCLNKNNRKLKAIFMVEVTGSNILTCQGTHGTRGGYSQVGRCGSCP